MSAPARNSQRFGGIKAWHSGRFAQLPDAVRILPEGGSKGSMEGHKTYDEMTRNLDRLITHGDVQQAMELSPKLMKDGSYQVEMSDEGLMTSDIEEWLEVVVKALKKCDLPPKMVLEQCGEMTKNGRIGYICDRELEALRKKFEG
jgi:hypothetical protein